MNNDTLSSLGNVITIDDERIKSHLDRVARGSVEETLNALLDASGVSLTTMAPFALPINAMTVPRCRTSSRNSVIALSRLAYMICPFSSVHFTHVAIVGFLKLAVYIGFG